MALQKEVWSSFIQENLYKSSKFVLNSVDHTQWVTNLRVHIPNAGGNPTITKNRASFPATIAQRTDNDLSYTINQYSTSPIHIPDLDQYQISYDKRSSVLKQDVEYLDEVIGNQTAYAWAPTNMSRVARTSGAAVATALAPGATGTRNAITLADILKLKAILDNDNIPQDGRALLIPSDIYNNQLMAIQDVYRQDFFSQQRILPDGVINRIHGFDIYVRPTVIVYSGGTGATQTLAQVDDSGTPINTGATQNLGIIAYHPSYVCHAKSDTKIFFNEGSVGSDGLPDYLGSILAAAVYHGASILRSDLKGVCALVQQ